MLVPPRAAPAGSPPLSGAEPLSSRVRPRPGGERVAELLDDVWVAERADSPSGARRPVTREGHRYDADRGELWFAGETAEAVLLELDARRRSLARRGRASSSGRRGAREPPSRPPRLRHEPARGALPTGCRGRARRRRSRAERRRRFEAPLRARADAGATSARRARRGAAPARRRGGRGCAAQAGEAAERLSAVDVERARLTPEADEARRRLEEAGAEPAEGDDRDELAAKLERLERRREALGQVNPLAKEEYEREKERLAELVEQREDLEASLKELEELRAELAETVERRFDETFDAVERALRGGRGDALPGRRGPAAADRADEDERRARPGVEVELRPAGKRVTRLSLLSGGEKALGAISFLFALFLARPCPFYLLDEVEAALDDTNIGRFVELLRRYSDRAQFIVVTHQKRTMEAADMLYGVTMGGDGVSQIVSRRLPREDAEAAA